MTNGLLTRESDLPLAARRAIVSDLITAWRKKQYNIEVNIRVSRKVGHGPDIETQQVAELRECEIALDELRALAGELDSEQPIG